MHSDSGVRLGAVPSHPAFYGPVADTALQQDNVIQNNDFDLVNEPVREWEKHA